MSAADVPSRDVDLNGRSYDTSKLGGQSQQYLAGH